MSPIKLVVTDLDNTLLSPDRTISDRAVAVMDAIRKRGVHFTFITGRPPYAVERFSQRMKLTDPIVCCNGAVIVQGGTVLLRRSLPLAPLRPLMEWGAALGLTVLLYANGTEYTLSDTDWVRSRRAAGKPFPLFSFSTSGPDSAEKVNFMADGRDAAFLGLLPELKTFMDRYSISLYGSNGCEIVASGVNKGTGLLALCTILGVSPSETLAVGDDANDHELLRAAGVGAAVANAVDSVKSCADFCCAAPYTDGVIEAVERFCGR